MLKLKNIVKDYITIGESVHALRNININFRKSEFVSILGQSGCGKTTLLNIIGGLDRYTSGDLIINGKSTEEFNDREWDSYRNHSIGFVFQNYNLIPHQTVLENVELALTLSGVGKEKRKKMAKEALVKVGLKDKLNVKPNQLSGGQMQRVAIARAIVNNPDILLADEPTGALDSKTSIQILDLLKEIANDRLVIMVTHNPELAETYSTRIITLVDGQIISDSAPYEGAQEQIERKPIKKKTSMSFFTALSLSFRNLLTKKGRTFLVAFAGSIGIIGIATILAISSGFKSYIKNVEEDTLSTYPITILEQQTNMQSTLEAFIQKDDGIKEIDENVVSSNDVFSKVMSSLLAGTHSNNLEEFNRYLIENNLEIGKYTSAIDRNYNAPVIVYSSDTDKDIFKVNPSSVFEYALKTVGLESVTNTFTNNMVIWSQMLDNEELVHSQYDLIGNSRWPKEYNEIVLVVDKNNRISDYSLYALGLKPKEELVALLKSIVEGNEFETAETNFTIDELLNMTFKLVINTDLYEKNMNVWSDVSNNNAKMKEIIDNKGIDLKVVGIIRPNPDAISRSIPGNVAYTSKLVEYIIDAVNDSNIVKDQKATPNIDIFTGLPFSGDMINLDMIKMIVNNLPDPQKEQSLMLIKYMEDKGMTDEEIVEKIKENIGTSLGTTYNGNLKTLGVSDIASPNSISIYPKDFASKDEIVRIIDEYNNKVTAEGREELVIEYTDYIGLLMSSISEVIDAISYVLFAFVAISLVVSSIMIGIITYISVLERIKEIGILRSVGASKVDISRVFNAETMIIGFTSGILGILLTLVLLIPINLIIGYLADIHNVAKLPVVGALILVIISVLLSLIAGIIPSMFAAKKNPVEALRSE